MLATLEWYLYIDDMRLSIRLAIYIEVPVAIYMRASLPSLKDVIHKDE